MGALLGLVGIAGFIVGLISLFRPLTALRIQNRKQAGIVLGVSFVVLLVGGALTPLEEDAGTAAPTTTKGQQGTTTTLDSSETTVPTTGATTTTAGASTTTTGQATTTTIEPTTTTTEDLPGIGDPVRDGKFEFVVTGIEEPGKVYDPDDVFEDEAVGEWFIVFMTVENMVTRARRSRRATRRSYGTTKSLMRRASHGTARALRS